MQVILTGGLDLSVPWTIGLSGILVAGIVHGSNGALIYAVPIVLVVAVLIGFLNGLGVVALGLSPIVVTLAMNGLLQGAALIYSNGTPDGFAAPALRWLMTGEILGLTPIIPYCWITHKYLSKSCSNTKNTDALIKFTFIYNNLKTSILKVADNFVVVNLSDELAKRLTVVF